MGEFHRHPDGLVYVRGENAAYVDTQANFEADFGVALDAMPAGADEQIYSQGRRHAFMGAGSIVDGGPMPWPAGNALIAAVADGLAAQAARIAAATPPPPPVDLTAYAADARWRKETGGIVLAGMPIATDDRSKLMIMGARLAAQSDSQWSTVWIGADGGAYPIDAPTIVQISDAVADHVNACFATFVEVKAAIAAETITTTEQVDAAFEG